MKLPSKLGPLEFLRQTKVELALVHWPNRQETTKLTTMVIVVSVLTALYLGALDAGFTSLFAKIINH